MALSAFHFRSDRPTDNLLVSQSIIQRPPTDSRIADIVYGGYGILTIVEMCTMVNVKLHDLARKKSFERGMPRLKSKIGNDLPRSRDSLSCTIVKAERPHRKHYRCFIYK